MVERGTRGCLQIFRPKRTETSAGPQFAAPEAENGIMGTAPPPVGGTPKDPYEGYKVEPIQEDKRYKEQPPEETSESQSSLLFASFLWFINRFLRLFSARSARGLAKDLEQEIRSRLLLLKAAFETMKKEDRSQDSDLLAKVSDLWRDLIEDSQRFDRAPQFQSLFQTTLHAIASFPEGQIHNLGYYLEEYHGARWLPFPFMELVFKLHREHQEQPSGSHLQQWTQNLDHLVRSLAQ